MLAVRYYVIINGFPLDITTIPKMYLQRRYFERLIMVSALKDSYLPF